VTAEPAIGRLRRLIRRFLVALGAAALLWFGWNAPVSHRAAHAARWMKVDGLRLRALEAGRGDTTLLFLHGYGESLLAWRQLLDHFTPHYRVLAVDLPGFGLSDKPLGNYDYPTYARWLGDLLAHEIKGPVIVVGHSMGGQIAAGLALDHPERVVAAVLIAPAGAGISPLLSDTGGIAAPSTQWVVNALSYVFPVHDPAWLRDAAAMAGYDPAADSASAHAARQVLRQFDFSALTHRFGELHQPVLLIWGRQDPTIPFDIGQRIAADLPCRQFVSLLALHRPHQTIPDTVAAAMDTFLRQPSCGTRAPEAE
jgi:pimeloyl-ACP methyl ester carboxylesterase